MKTETLFLLLSSLLLTFSLPPPLLPPPLPSPKEDDNIIFIDIVITVKTPIKFVRNCVDALLRHSPSPLSSLQQRVVFVDDGSPAETLKYEHKMCRTHPFMFFCTKTHEQEPGYTFAVERGMHYIAKKGLKESYAVILLNSDTIVTDGWIYELYQSLTANNKTMIVGPLSNAATWQSMPNPQVADNTVPLGLSIDTISHEVKRYAHTNKKKAKPVSIYIINGFCFMFKRELLQAIGGFDTVNFGPGYGEEVDFCLRAHKKGFLAQIIPSAYVYHTKTASFQSDEKKELNKKAHVILESKYKKILAKYKTEKAVSRSKLKAVARNVASLYDSYKQKYSSTFVKPSLMFILSKFFHVDDVLSLLRSVLYMRANGLDVVVQVLNWDESKHPTLSDFVIEHFPDILPADMKAIISTTSTDNEALPMNADVVVATSLDALPHVTRICSMHPHSRPVYLASDYPILSKFASQQERNSHERYVKQLSSHKEKVTVLSSSQWVSQAIEAEVDKLKVKHIAPYIDYNIFHISKEMLHEKMTKKKSGDSSRILFRFGGVSEIDQTLVKAIFLLLRQSPLPSIRILDAPSKNYLVGLCRAREVICGDENILMEETLSALKNIEYIRTNDSTASSDMAAYFRESDIFIDGASLKEWNHQRSFIEAFACGCITLLPDETFSQAMVSEVVGRNGLDVLFDGSNVNKLVTMVSVLLENQNVHESATYAGLDISRRYSYEEGVLSFLRAVSVMKEKDDIVGHNTLIEKSYVSPVVLVICAVCAIGVGMMCLPRAKSAKK